MSSYQLFLHRMIRDWKFQFRAFRSIADWTIWLYFIIPANIISIFIYRSWWVEGAPTWIEWMPLNILFLVGYLFSWNGTYRTFTEEADKVFLTKKSSMFLNLKRWGFAYSLFFQGIMTLLVVVILLPFIINHYHLTWTHALLYFFYLLGIKYLIMYLEFQLKKIERKTIRIIITVLTYIGLGCFTYLASIPWENGQFLVLFLISVVMGLLGIGLYFPLLKRNSLFEVGLTVEKEEKMKLINLIYQASYDIEKTKVVSRKKPWLFRNSKRIFKNRTSRNGFIELFIKVFVRNSSYIFTYFQISSVTGAALIVVPPIWIKVLIFGCFLFMMWVWLGITWDRIVLSHPFTKKYNEADAYFSAQKRTITVLFVISIFIVGIIVIPGWILLDLVRALQIS